MLPYRLAEYVKYDIEGQGYYISDWEFMGASQR